MLISLNPVYLIQFCAALVGSEQVKLHPSQLPTLLTNGGWKTILPF